MLTSFPLANNVFLSNDPESSSLSPLAKHGGFFFSSSHLIRKKALPPKQCKKKPYKMYTTHHEPRALNKMGVFPSRLAFVEKRRWAKVAVEALPLIQFILDLILQTRPGLLFPQLWTAHVISVLIKKKKRKDLPVTPIRNGNLKCKCSKSKH